jgi:hypothetical protein
MPGTLLTLPIESLPEVGARLSRLRERYPHVDELEQFVECVYGLQPLAVILFGSLATGEFTQHSDADVAVIFASPVDWMSIYRCSSGRIQPLAYTAEQFVQMINQANGLALEICHNGWILAGQPAYLRQLKETFAEARRRYGLEKTSCLVERSVSITLSDRRAVHIFQQLLSQTNRISEDARENDFQGADDVCQIPTPGAEVTDRLSRFNELYEALPNKPDKVALIYIRKQTAVLIGGS